MLLHQLPERLNEVCISSSLRELAHDIVISLHEPGQQLDGFVHYVQVSLSWFPTCRFYHFRQVVCIFHQHLWHLLELAEKSGNPSRVQKVEILANRLVCLCTETLDVFNDCLAFKHYFRVSHRLALRQICHFLAFAFEHLLVEDSQLHLLDGALLLFVVIVVRIQLHAAVNQVQRLRLREQIKVECREFHLEVAQWHQIQRCVVNFAAQS